MKCKILSITLIFHIIIRNEAAKILAVFPTPSISHQIVFRSVMFELTKRGHEIVMITPNPQFSSKEPPKNYREIDVQDVSQKVWERMPGIIKGYENDFYVQIKSVFELLNDAVEAQIKSDAVQKLINDENEKFDLVFFESCARPALAFSYLYKVPVIEFSSLGGLFGMFDRIGAVSHRLFYPMPLRQKFYNLSIWEKLSELYTYSFIDYSYMQSEKAENKMLKRLFGPNIPDLNELEKNIDMIFLNIHPVWDFNRPVPPNVIYLGGVHQNPDRELPEDLKSYLDGSEHGVIYMSLGTNVKSSMLSEETLQMFNNVFSHLPYDVLWKWDKDVMPGQSKKVRTSKWFPQSDLLKHPKIKLFITQGGLQSTDEALNAGVPLIALPMFTDQWFNAEQYLAHEIGLKLNIHTITEGILKEAIETVIGNHSYRKNVLKLRDIVRDRPHSSLEDAVWWTEYILRHGGAKHLRAAAADLHWTEYYMLDLVLVLFSIFTATLTVIVLSIRLILKKYKQTPPKRKKC